MAKKVNPLVAMLKAPKKAKKDIPSAFDMKTGVDVGKGPKTMPKKMAKKAVKGGGKMPMKGKKSC